MGDTQSYLFIWTTTADTTTISTIVPAAYAPPIDELLPRNVFVY